MFRNNYIVSEVEYDDLDNDQYQIDGKIYHVHSNLDPEYQNDGVLDISYWVLYDEEDEPTDYILAYDKIADVDQEDISEWSDEYDNPHILHFS
jgi:hypothetical protein